MCDYLSMQGLKLIHVSKRGPSRLAMRHVTLAAITGTTILVPYLLVKSLHVIWISSACTSYLLVPNLQLSCKDLITWQGTRIVVPAMAIRWHVPLSYVSFAQNLQYGTCRGIGTQFVLSCVLLWFGLTHNLQGYFTGTGAILRLPQCQWSNHEHHR